MRLLQKLLNKLRFVGQYGWMVLGVYICTTVRMDGLWVYVNGNGIGRTI